MPRALDSVVRMGRDATSAGAVIIRTLEQFLRTTDGAIGAIHAPFWCDDNVAAAAGYAAEALWKNICKHNSSAPVTHDCYLKLFYLQGRELSPRECTVMLDEAQDADPVILGLLERHKGARIIVGDKYQQLYQWRGAVNALSRMRSQSAELSLTRTFRFGPGAAEWANRVLRIIGERLRIIPAPHRTTVSIEEKSLTIDAQILSSGEMPARRWCRIPRPPPGPRRRPGRPRTCQLSRRGSRGPSCRSRRNRSRESVLTIPRCRLSHSPGPRGSSGQPQASPHL
jgi:UvrD-like helicase family protein